jgi:DtxR family Mn-dependent transcriptional regulator
VLIVHLEDEPSALYEQLVAKRLCAGQLVEVVERSSAGVRIRVEGRSHMLPAVAAAQILAVPASPAGAAGLGSLAALPLGAAGRVTEISPACRGVERRRLLDLGLVPGTEVRAEIDSPAGGLRAYRIRGALIALRDDQAEQVRLALAQQRV